MFFPTLCIENVPHVQKGNLTTIFAGLNSRDSPFVPDVMSFTSLITSSDKEI